MMCWYESFAYRQLVECGVELAFEARSQRDIANRPADLADEVMMMLGEIFGKLISSVLGGVNQAPHDADILHNRQIAVGRTLGKLGRKADEFGQRHRSVGPR